MNEPKILIVEDELLIAQTLCRRLRKFGYHVVDTLTSGLPAIERAITLKPDLILMDIALEGDIDGIETAIRILEKVNIPVIYTTAYADDNTLERAEATGAYGYIIKPFRERDLHAAIKMALQKHKEQLKMQQSLEMAQTVSEDKSRYLSIASHDMRTPLTAIKMSADMLKRYDQKWPETKKAVHFARIQDAVTNMSQMLEEVLTLSMAEAGKLSFNPAPLEVINFCQLVLEGFRPLTTGRHELIFKSSTDFLVANLDEALLRCILSNLLANALKYSPEGGMICLQITSSLQEVSFQVEDQGIGIPAEDLSKVFDQFERANNVGSIKGSGLGLYIVKLAVNLQGGQIWVESKVGEGTRFKVTLPICQ